MIQEKKEWALIRSQCYNLLDNYCDTNEFALNIIIEINFEILIGNALIEPQYSIMELELFSIILFFDDQKAI